MFDFACVTEEIAESFEKSAQAHKKVFPRSSFWFSTFSACCLPERYRKSEAKY